MRTTTLGWAVGTFCAVMGALMLVSPHQFGGPAYAALRPYLWPVGASFLLAGTGLLGAAVMPAKPGLQVGARLFAGGAILALAQGFAATGAWAGFLVYAVLGLGTAIAPAFSQTPEDEGRRPRGDFFALLMGLGASVAGLVILAVPSPLMPPPVRSVMMVYGGVVLGGGLALVFTQLRPAAPRALGWAAHLVVAGAYCWYLVAVSLPSRSWPGMTYYGGFGALLALLPWLGPRLRRANVTSLKTRLALALAATAALPLVVGLALVNRQGEDLATAEELEVQEHLAAVLAVEVADYVGFHRAAVETLALLPGLLDSSPATQGALLRSINQAYPDIVAFSTCDADGNQLARSDDRPLMPCRDFRAFHDARDTDAPALDVLIGPLVQRPVFALAAPIRGADGRFTGLVAGVLESERLAALLDRAAIGEDRGAYVVDGRGRVIAHPDASLVAGFADLSRTPPVGVLLARAESSGFLSYRAPSGERLVGHALVPGPGWHIVVERSLASAHAALYAGRDLAFAMLLLVIVVAAILGTTVADRLTAPLSRLAAAAARLASGDVTAPLPGSSVTEVAHLADQFSQMRDRLVARSAERDRAEQERARLLIQAQEELRARREFLAVVTHDLKNPLAAIKALAQLLHYRAEQGNWAQEAKALATMDAAADRMSSMINQLLEAARLEAGQELQLDLAEVDLWALAVRLVEQHRASAGRHELRLQGVGPGIAIGRWDPTRLEQIIGNLVGNAVKYSPAGGLVELVVEQDGEQARVAVRDRGIGIPREAMTHLFEPFYRAGNVAGGGAVPGIGGLGLGLFSAQRIAHLHGGRIEAISEEGRGSTFTLVLPLAGPAGATLARAPSVADV